MNKYIQLWLHIDFHLAHHMFHKLHKRLKVQMSRFLNRNYSSPTILFMSTHKNSFPSKKIIKILYPLYIKETRSTFTFSTSFHKIIVFSFFPKIVQKREERDELEEIIMELHAIPNRYDLEFIKEEREVFLPPFPLSIYTVPNLLNRKWS